jgi:signal transduction histidine kinase
MAQVLSNLLTNAAKYSDTGSRITVTSAREGSMVRVVVKDEGIGIAPGMLDSIFDAFVQQPHALDRASGGLGLGLAIVRSLVEAHGGTVRAASAGPNRGSELIVTIPAAAAAAVQEDGKRAHSHRRPRATAAARRR